MNMTMIKRSRGRPARTSREDILEAACTQLKSAPFEELSLSALARSMGLTPMALYRYFDDKNDLQQAIAERLMQLIVLDLPDGESWQRRLHAWASGMREAFCANPQVMSYIGWQGHIASAWIKLLARLAKILQDAGIPPAEQPMMLKWVSSSIIGFIVITIGRQQDQVALDENDMPHDDSFTMTIMQGLGHELRAIDDNAVFEYNIEQIIRRIEQL